MISFATYLCGMRIRVYRAEGTTQWYTAVSTGYNANTQVNIKCIATYSNIAMMSIC